MTIVRDFKSTDYNKLTELWQELGLGRPERGDNLTVIKETLKRGGKLLLLELDDQLIGTAWITNNGRRLYLHHMGISKAYQGRGYGKRLMDEIMNFASSVKMQLKLEVHIENDNARRLYEQYRFEELEGYRVLINRKTSG